MNPADPRCGKATSAVSARNGCDRRQFLKTAAAVPAVMATAELPAAPSPSGPTKMPYLEIGKYSISRLVCGANPFHGGSHLSVFVNREMRSYYTPEQILKTLRRCQQEGVNTWQSGPNHLELFRRYLDAGGKMHFLVIASGDPKVLPKLAQGGCIGAAHHGEVTDNLFKAGKLDQVNEYLKHVRQSGMLVGVSTHMPAVVDAIESKGWDLDYYMTCVYQRHRNEQDLQQLLGHVPLPVGEVYLKSDPPRMFRAMQQTKRPCLAFKILAAGRLSEHRPWVEQAFRETFASIKRNDGVIVGIYDRYSDQAAEDAALVRRFG
jgi:hypothetical protein